VTSSWSFILQLEDIFNIVLTNLFAWLNIVSLLVNDASRVKTVLSVSVCVCNEHIIIKVRHRTGSLSGNDSDLYSYHVRFECVAGSKRSFSLFPEVSS